MDRKKPSGAERKICAGWLFYKEVLWTRVLFINPVDSNFKKCFFSVEFIFSVIAWECNGYINRVARMMTDELIFKIVDIAMGTNDEVSAVSFGISAFKFHAVDGSHIVNIDRIAVFDGERSIGL